MKGKCGDKTNQEWLQRVNIRIFRKIMKIFYKATEHLLQTLIFESLHLCNLMVDGVIDIFRSSRTVRNIKGDHYDIKNNGIRIRV